MIMSIKQKKIKIELAGIKWNRIFEPYLLFSNARHFFGKADLKATKA